MAPRLNTVKKFHSETIKLCRTEILKSIIDKPVGLKKALKSLSTLSIQVLNMNIISDKIWLEIQDALVNTKTKNIKNKCEPIFQKRLKLYNSRWFPRENMVERLISKRKEEQKEKNDYGVSEEAETLLDPEILYKEEDIEAETLYDKNGFKLNLRFTNCSLLLLSVEWLHLFPKIKYEINQYSASNLYNVNIEDVIQYMMVNRNEGPLFIELLTWNQMSEVDKNKLKFQIYKNDLRIIVLHPLDNLKIKRENEDDKNKSKEINSNHSLAYTFYSRLY